MTAFGTKSKQNKEENSADLYKLLIRTQYAAGPLLVSFIQQLDTISTRICQNDADYYVKSAVDTFNNLQSNTNLWTE